MDRGWGLSRKFWGFAHIQHGDLGTFMRSITPSLHRDPTPLCPEIDNHWDQGKLATYALSGSFMLRWSCTEWPGNLLEALLTRSASTIHATLCRLLKVEGYKALACGVPEANHNISSDQQYEDLARVEMCVSPCIRPHHSISAVLFIKMHASLDQTYKIGRYEIPTCIENRDKPDGQEVAASELGRRYIDLESAKSRENLDPKPQIRKVLEAAWHQSPRFLSWNPSS